MSEEVTIKKSTYNKILAGLFVLAVAFAFSTGYIIGGTGSTTTGGTVVQQQPAPQGQPDAAPQAPSRVQVSVDDDPALGQSSAPVTVIEFSDFECPFCERAYTQIVGPLENDYVKTGKVKFVFRDFPLSFHPEALPAALAADCANEQGKFWEYHNALFGNQDKLGEAFYNSTAKDLGLNTNQFYSCWSSKKYESEISSDEAAGGTAGVQGTPTFFIGSPSKGYVKIVGAQPYANIKQAIDQELAA